MSFAVLSSFSLFANQREDLLAVLIPLFGILSYLVQDLFSILLIADGFHDQRLRLCLISCHTLTFQVAFAQSVERVGIVLFGCLGETAFPMSWVVPSPFL